MIIFEITAENDAWLKLKGKQHLVLGPFNLTLYRAFDEIKSNSIPGSVWNTTFSMFKDKIEYALEILETVPDINDQSIRNFSATFNGWLANAYKMDAELRAAGLI